MSLQYTIQVGQQLIVDTASGHRHGIVRYYGPTQFHHTRRISISESYGIVDNTWIGLELVDGNIGKNNGTVDGVHYFDTINNTISGLFIRSDKVIAIDGRYVNGGDIQIHGGIQSTTPTHRSSVSSLSMRSPTGIKSPISSTPMKSPSSAPVRNINPIQKSIKPSTSIKHSGSRSVLSSNGEPSSARSDHSSTSQFNTSSTGADIDWNKRNLFVFGENIHGELGVNKSGDLLEPEQLTLPNNSQFAQMSLGLHHSVVLSMNNSVYTCGQWISGLLGHTNIRHDIHKPALVKSFSKLKSSDYNQRIISIACADRHSVALLASGELYTWGGTLYGKLGRTRTSTEKNDTPFAVLQQLRDKHITHVDCGNHHTVVVTEQGEVYAIGQSHEKGKPISNIVDENSFVPRRIDSLISSNIHIRDVVCGGYHTLVLSSDAQLYSWGKGEFGQLGLGSDTHTAQPQLITSLSKVISMSAGENHSMCVCSDGTVYTWGYGGQGQLGHGTNVNEKLPRRIEYFYKNNIKIVQCAAGWRHSIVLSNELNVYTFGHNDHGQLGTGDMKSSSIPRLIDTLPRNEIRHVAAGGNHTLVSNFYFKTAAEMNAIQQINQNIASNSNIAPIQQTPIPVSPTESNISYNHINHYTHSIQSPIFDSPIESYQFPQSDYRLVCELVYSSNLSCIHRFVTFVTSSQYSQQCGSALREYIQLLYKYDSNVIFDDLLITPGSTVACTQLERYNEMNVNGSTNNSNTTNDSSWNEYKYDYDQQNVRMTLLIVYKRTSNNIIHSSSIHWPQWCSELLYIICTQCSDINESVLKYQNRPLVELSRHCTSVNELDMYVPCFREITNNKIT